MKTVNIGILGLGTVGGGTYEILDMNRELIEKRIGREIKVAKVLEKNTERLKALGLPEERATPVSYTHLDVYKRQTVILLRIAS